MLDMSRDPGFAIKLASRLQIVYNVLQMIDGSTFFTLSYFLVTLSKFTAPTNKTIKLV